MVSQHNSSETVKDLADWYGGDVVAVEQGYPGVFTSPVEKHEFGGEIDLLVSEGGTPEKLRAYEVKEVGSLEQTTILDHAFNARKQCDRIEEYLSGMGYEVDASYIISPEGHLKAAYEVWHDLPEIFELDKVGQTLSEPGRYSHLKDTALEEKEDNLYELDDSLAALMETGIVQP